MHNSSTHIYVYIYLSTIQYIYTIQNYKLYTTMRGPQKIARLVNITPISLWFVYDT